jgi:hypothetical protein
VPGHQAEVDALGELKGFKCQGTKLRVMASGMLLFIVLRLEPSALASSLMALIIKAGIIIKAGLIINGPHP